MSLLSPFSLSILCSSQPLQDDRDSDPSSSPSDSPPLLPDLDFTVSRPQRRRWTLAMAMTDEGMTDEAFVETLERFRLERDPSGPSAVWDVNRDTWNWNLQWEGAIDEKKREPCIPHTSSLPSLPLHHSLSVPSSPKLGTTWQTARQALLACRELVRTERHYLSSLKILIASKTATLPPPLMIHYASQLASVSERYLARLEEDPSVLGVATSFLGLEEAVEGAFVGWCGVVGGWFEGRGALAAVSQAPSPKRRLSKGHSEGDIPTLVYPANGGLRRTVSAWRRNVPTMTHMNTSAASQGPSFSSSFLGWRKDRSVLGPGTHGHQIKRPPVRDLAILPTQRVLRYVLLYRDLLAHTPPTSPSRGLVERAVEAVTRIAQKCDRAQDNSAFLVKPDHSSKIYSIRSRKASTG
ncbi:hypothetical protein APHAL10511_005870 [Amanita phalloides]|nr:hypothetical protein APHAL10511_005870 [Amanita phalloides]